MKAVVTVVTLVCLAPFIALLGGVGILALRIGDTWTEATTASMITGFTTVCGGGAVVIALILSLVVGIPMATRFFAEQGLARKAWGEAPPYYYPGLPGPARQWREDMPPMLEARNDAGTWQTSQQANYDLWEEEPAYRPGPQASGQ